MPHKILIAPTTFCVFDAEPEQRLKQQGFEIVKNPHARKLSERETVDLGKDCVGVIAGTEKYTDDVLAKMPLLKIISRVGVGMDNIDMFKAQEKKIKVCGTVTPLTSAVAELTLGLILSSLRQINHQDRVLKAGRWEKTMGSLLEGKSLGVIGLGKIGKRLIKLTQGFDLKYRACDINPDIVFARENKVEICGLDALLSQSDIVSIHLSPTPTTTTIIDYEKLKLMKSNAIIINTSRGEVIDEASLITALKQGLIAGAGLDVFESEPYSGPLLALDNVIATPHVGSYAKEVRTKMELEAVENLLAGLGVAGTALA